MSTATIDKPVLSIRTTANNPFHHLWNNNGTWWVHYTEHLPDHTKHRVRRSLHTADSGIARVLRDSLLCEAAHYEEEVSRCTAKEAIELLNAYPGDSSSDPPLNRIIALLLYRFDGQPNLVYNATPGSSRIDEDFRNYSGFFIQNRVRAIINAVLRGEAPGKVLEALQAELNRTARGHSVMYLGMYCQSFARQVLWLKGRIMECFDSDPVELYWEKTSESSYPFLMEGFDLNTLLKTPLREPYAHEIPKSFHIG